MDRGICCITFVIISFILNMLSANKFSYGLLMASVRNSSYPDQIKMEYSDSQNPTTVWNTNPEKKKFSADLRNKVEPRNMNATQILLPTLLSASFCM